jgi:hypothetical protein
MFGLLCQCNIPRLNTLTSSQGHAFNLFETSPLRRSLSRALLLNYPNCKRANTSDISVELLVLSF